MLARVQAELELIDREIDRSLLSPSPPCRWFMF